MLNFEEVETFTEKENKNGEINRAEGNEGTKDKISGDILFFKGHHRFLK